MRPAGTPRCCVHRWPTIICPSSVPSRRTDGCSRTFNERPFRGPTIVTFLGQLQRQIAGKLLVLWDGASIHHGEAVKQSLAGGAAARLHLESASGGPPYAPELNPDEGAWSQLKRVELKNRCCQTVAELRWEMGLAIRRLQWRPQVITACFRQCGYI